MALITEQFVLTNQWEAPGAVGAALYVSGNQANVQCCFAASEAEADGLSTGHNVSAKSGLILIEPTTATAVFLRTSVDPDASDLQPEVTVSVLVP